MFNILYNKTKDHKIIVRYNGFKTLSVLDLTSIGSKFVGIIDNLPLTSENFALSDIISKYLLSFDEIFENINLSMTELP